MGGGAGGRDGVGELLHCQDTHCNSMLVDYSELPDIPVEVKLAVSGSEGRGELLTLYGYSL